VDLFGKEAPQSAKDYFHVLADRLAQELLPRRHRPLKVLLALGFQVQADLFEQLLVVVVSVALVGIMIEPSGKSNSDSLNIATSARTPPPKRTPPALRLR
jgi:hypothetical protein